MHQKQPPAKVAAAAPGGVAGSFAICAHTAAAAKYNGRSQSLVRTKNLKGGGRIIAVFTGRVEGGGAPQRAVGRWRCPRTYAPPKTRPHRFDYSPRRKSTTTDEQGETMRDSTKTR